MKRIRRMVSSITVLGLLLTSAACGGPQEPGTSGGSGEKKAVEVWVRDNVAKLLETPVKQFNDSHPNIQVKMTSVPAASFSEQFATAVASKNLPDVVSIDLVLAPYFASVGAFKDITASYGQLAYKDQLNANMVNMGKYNGKQYALPLSADVSALIYNKDHFKDAGLDPEKPPVTWKELREYAKKLTTNDRFGFVYSASVPGTLMFTFLPFLWGNGGSITSDDGKQVLIDKPESVEALKFMSDLTNEDKAVPAGSPTYGGQQAYDAFTSGKASMIVYGNFKVSDLNLNFPKINYGVALIPKNEGKQHSSFAGGDLVALTATTKQEKEAWEFVNYLLSKDVQVEFFAKNGTIPVRSDFFDNTYFQKEPRFKVFTEALKVAKTPYSTKHNEILRVWTSTQDALQGKKSAEEVFKNQSVEIKKLVDSK
ncbi:ABC transporter substrate-binding protein [Paenibacillus piri]|uniref:ABC transporter substrate-binding protein n=1 Tax=Paenibacillus piri TaxID=2547395 RepID=A0A4R5K6N9_9BACL|nr:ABC transporter substrate-binding protein [Paenibacillus piri]TDF88917.1 ABC transporter substrate-binding protein [Paenibacillus piri]